mmetsp:Transcript_40271/g.85909  ORF Transcript_40271/g.85909 Transcript_40271/m.85909 type:complete len:112 (+) Transcript_40271:76-411(+)
MGGCLAQGGRAADERKSPVTPVGAAPGGWATATADEDPTLRWAQEVVPHQQTKCVPINVEEDAGGIDFPEEYYDRAHPSKAMPAKKKNPTGVRGSAGLAWDAAALTVDDVA